MQNFCLKLFYHLKQWKNVINSLRTYARLCTVPELKALSQRLQVAKMLDEQYVYSDIVRETGASTATISRVNRSLEYGCDGYRVVFDRLEEKCKKKEEEK